MSENTGSQSNTNNTTAPSQELPTIKYAIIGYGAAAAQFLVDLVFWHALIKEKGYSFPAKIEITVYSSADKNEDGAGDAWNSTQDGTTVSKIPRHPEWLPEETDTSENSRLFTLSQLRNLYFPFNQEAGASANKKLEALKLEVLKGIAELSSVNGDSNQALLTGLHDKISAKLEDENIPAFNLYSQNPVLDWVGQKPNTSDLSKPSLPRYIVGRCRKSIMNKLLAIVKEECKDCLTIEIHNRTWARIDNIDDPTKPRLTVSKNYHFTRTGAERPWFNKVIVFSGTRRKSPIHDLVISAAYTGAPNYPAVKKYLVARGCDGKSVAKKIGFAGAQLSFVDNVSIVCTVRSFLKPQKSAPFYEIQQEALNFPDHLVVISREATGSFKPLLHHGMVWSREIADAQRGPAPSYLLTEHLLALRTQRGYEWIKVVEAIWKAMISYTMKIHPRSYPHYTRMKDEWAAYLQQCKDSRDGKYTFCALERTLVNALLHGYGAEINLQEAKDRMAKSFPDIFVSGERMFAAFYAHISSSTCIRSFGPNDKAMKTLTNWHRIYSSSPIEVCEPIFDLAVRGIITHVKANATDIELDSESRKFVLKSDPVVCVDALFAPNPFGTGLDASISPITERLQKEDGTQQEDGVRKGNDTIVWRTNGQLVEKHPPSELGRRVNVWDRSNNRGIGLRYPKPTSESTIRPWIGTNALAAAHDFGSSLALSLLADDVYTTRGVEDPFRKLGLERGSAEVTEYDRQMTTLDTHFDEVMERYYYLQAIEEQLDPAKWRTLYEKGMTKKGRGSALEGLDPDDDSEQAVHTAYLRYLQDDSLVKRKSMEHGEWWAPFTDPELPKAWAAFRRAKNGGN
ncbi:unnamed protein product [Rhizoctonia solani]|uniref:Uncharacterized protein n=1 Tax=Rhizoctonia solani TaxID=456999 RepID=A0A8H3C647_9AGAM|nr:unnamed protein product [Rhizoctonia solani]